MERPEEPNQALSAAFDWLRMADALPAGADVVIGFGHFDLRIPRLCGELAERLRPKCLVFTGGFGAGTGNLGRPEADAFRDEVARAFPALATPVVAENASTNTAENIRFTRALLEERHPEWAFGRGIRTAVLGATPARLRRVRQTWLHLVPEVAAFAIAPETRYAADAALLAANGIAIDSQIVGELARLRDYPARGWIAPISLPPPLAALVR